MSVEIRCRSPFLVHLFSFPRIQDSICNAGETGGTIHGSNPASRIPPAFGKQRLLKLRNNLIPIAAAIVTLSAFAIVNADGQPLHLLRFPLQSRNPNLPSFQDYKVPQERVFNSGGGNWIHGWPFAGLFRIGVYPVGKKGQPSARSFPAPFAAYSRWPFDNCPWDHVNVYALLLNAALAIFVTCDTYVWVRDGGLTRYRFSITSLFAATLFVALLVTCRKLFLDTHDIYEMTAILIALSCTIAALIRVPSRLASMGRELRNHANQRRTA
ncbi:hypothetical protein Pla52n_50650 [Stieleria varia]|uniref:Uncharacterized protein n=1 Tax=Stieleria varia TaxID=2528005 RepID=A0A5C6AG17_9BACT|nr:hypothetical protein Pla52n_50650 [Stieleria varia]